MTRGLSHVLLRAAALLVTAGATLVTLAASCAAGYVYARHHGRLLQGSAFLMLAARMLPPIIIVIPLFPAVNALGLNDRLRPFALEYLRTHHK